MKTVLLALVLIGATVALLALLPHGLAGGVRLEPRARPDRIAQVAPDAELVAPASMSPSELMPTLDHAPGETREAVPEAIRSPLLGRGLPVTVMAGSNLTVVDLLESGATLSSSGEITVDDSGNITLSRSGRITFPHRIVTEIVFSGVRGDRPDGTWIENHDGDKPKAQGQIRNGREVGLWIYWHENGERSAEGRYVNGARHGLWTTWHVDGSKESEGIYSYGEREGSWIDFHAGGKRKQVATYANGKLEGRVVRWHSNGTRESEGFCVGGDLDGSWRSWYATGITSVRGHYRYGKRVGRWTFLDPVGELDRSRSGRYENDQRVAD